jgi:hypothetical protein
VEWVKVATQVVEELFAFVKRTEAQVPTKQMANHFLMN